MNPKYQKVLSDIEKAEKKKSEIEGQLKELYDKKTELENLEIINTVRSMVMDKDQIMRITRIRMTNGLALMQIWLDLSVRSSAWMLNL